MKVKLLPVLFLLTSQFSISQIDKSIKGKVSSENTLLQNVDVINKTSKKSTVTDENGEFIIEAKANDSLVFYAKEFYLKKIKLSSSQIEQNNLDIIIFKKPEELEEVVIRTVAASAFVLRGDKKYEQGISDKMTLDKAASSPKTGVYDGTIENGMDFVRIGKMIIGLFAKDKEPTNEKASETEFSVLAKSICEEKFYLKTLKLKPEEIDLFLQFCAIDPKSKTVAKDKNILRFMDFLTIKNQEFQKLKETVR